MAHSANNGTTSTAVRRLLRCRKTQRYFNGAGWTYQPEHAHSFAHALDAARACVDHRLQNVELVLQLSNGHADLFSTPLR
ncbi:MAG TPA: hypothetical protein VG167_13510 [Verrucomicrobiae bacterium]|nr:hypothetical protein [Verrucomicrobiae bacterium]